MKRMAAALAVAGVIGSSPAMGGSPMAPTDDAGRVVAHTLPAQRIVSLLPSLTESVCALGACERLVGVDKASNWPATIRNLPQLGGLADTQLERLVALKPDLVLAPVSLRARARLSSLGLNVITLEPRSLADVHRTLQVLGRALGRDEAAYQLWLALEGGIDRAAGRVPTRLQGRSVYLEVSESPHAAAPGAFIGELLQRLGLRNVVPAGQGPFPALNPEFIVRASPDILMGAEASVARMPTRPGWSSLPALRQRQVCAFEPPAFDLLMRPGPRLDQAAAVLADCLQALARTSS